jgi:two-component system, LytTR family, sensor kinase
VATNLLRSIGDIHVPEVAAHDPEQPLRSRTRAALWLTLAFWGSGYALLTLATALSGNEHLPAIAGMRIVTTLIGLGFCYLIHLLLRHPRLTTNKRRLIALACVAPVAAELYAWAAFFAMATVDPSLDLKNFTWTSAINTIAFWTWFFLAWAGLYLALMYSFDVQDEQRRSAELREQAHVAQLRALHSQINPHFLFNSLNSVSALILDKNTDKAEEMVVKLARFLRLGLSADPTRKIPLELEVELQRSYLDIEQLRYPDLVVEVDVPEQMKGALVPSLILQPIVENAVKYGVAGAPPPATITIRATAAGERLSLEVIDSGKGAKHNATGGGIGLANVRQRLALLYGEGRTGLTAAREADGRFGVRISLPLEAA